MVPVASVQGGAKAARLQLTSDTATAMPGHSVVLTALTESSVTGTNRAIEIFDTSTGTLAGMCSQGNQCSVAYTAHAGRHSFAAFVIPPTSTLPTGTQALSSNPIAVSWIGVTMVADRAIVGPGRQVTLTATSTVAVDKTGWLLQIYDAPTHTRLTYCASGNTCRVTITLPVGGTRAVVAVLAPPTPTAPPSELVVAQTDIFLVHWLSLSVHAVTNSTQPGAVVHVVAMANADMTDSPWSIGIFDNHGQLVAPFCKSGNTCAADVTITGAMPSFRAAVGSVHLADSSVLSRLLQRAAAPPKLVDIQADSGLVTPTVHTSRTLWGVDSCKSFTGDANAGSGLYPQVASQLGVPDFWGRYLTNTVCPGISGAEVAAAHNKSMGILPIYNDYNCSNVVGYNTGWGYGAEAVAAARNIGIPEGVALAIDIEPPGAACPGAVNVDGAFVEGWYDALTGARYVPAFYGNGGAGSEFASAYCAAVTARPEVANNSHLWTFEPSLWGGYSKGNAPDWGLAYNTQCPEHGTVWQYMLSAGSTPDVDHDLMVSDFPLWYP